MPELPEVEAARRWAAELLVGEEIRRVEAFADEIVFVGQEAWAFADALRGRRVEAVTRRGKYLFFELDRRPWPLFHFGMTGGWRSPNRAPLPLEASPTSGDEVWPPRFAKLILETASGARLAFVNKRRLGRVRLQEDPLAEDPVAALGWDPLLAPPAVETLRAELGGRRAVLKGLLLDQSFLAGVGNWIADEVLFQAGIDPRRRADSLAETEVGRLHQALLTVISTAVAVDADKSRFPEDWLFHRRWGKDDEARTADGEPIEFLQVSGRTTAFVPARQS